MIAEFRLMYPYFRGLGLSRRRAFVSALTWTPVDTQVQWMRSYIRKRYANGG